MARAWNSNIYTPRFQNSPLQNSDYLRKLGYCFPFIGTAKFSGNGSQLVFNFGIEVSGPVILEYTATGPSALGLEFIEGKT